MDQGREGMAEAVTRHWLIDGRVQGVGYRMWLGAEADAAGVAGWAASAVVSGIAAAPATMIPRRVMSKLINSFRRSVQERKRAGVRYPH